MKARAFVAERWRRWTPAFVLLLLGAWLMLGQQSDVLRAMHPEACPAGTPVEFQWSPTGSRDGRELRGVVEAWRRHELDQFRESGHVVQAGPAGRAGCTGKLLHSNDTTSLSRANSPIDVARLWLYTDLVFFTPLYGLVLVGLLLNEGSRPDASGGPQSGRVERQFQRWLRRRWLIGLVGAGVAADLVENILLIRRVDAAWNEVTRHGFIANARIPDLGWVHLVGALKWAALAIPVLLLLGVFVLRAARRLVALRAALRKQWVLLALAAAFVAAMLFPAQGLDVVRDMSTGRVVITAVAVAVLSLVLAFAGATVLRARGTAPDTGLVGPPNDTLLRRIAPSLVLVVVAATVALLGVVTDRLGLLIPAGLAGAAAVLSMLIDWSPRAEVQRGFGDTQITNFADRLAVSSVGGALVVVGFGAVVVKTAAADLAYFRDTDGLVLRLVIGLAILAAGRLVRRGDGAAGSSIYGAPELVRTLILVGLTAAFGVGVIFYDPDLNLSAAPWFGTVGVLTLFLGGLAILYIWADRLSFYLAQGRDRRAIFMPTVLREFGMQRPPVVGFVVVWCVIAALAFRGYGHDVRIVRSNVVKAQSVRDLVDGWELRQASPEPRPGARSAAPPTGAPTAVPATPMLLVSSSGGGIRAAYWTAAVLDCVIERRSSGRDPCAKPAGRHAVGQRRRSLFALSGISGGSLGIAEYTSAGFAHGSEGPVLPREWYETRLDGDYLAPTLAAMLFDDGLNTLLRTGDAVDRAAVLERSWEREWKNGALGRHFLADQSGKKQPLLLFNGYSVEDGCRFEAAILSSNGQRDAQQCAKALTGSEGALLATTDLTDVLCPGTDVRWSTAALLSARFPWVSPTGAIGKRDCGEPNEHTLVVDGGYHETSAASPVNELVPEVVRDLPAGGRCVVPLHLQIDNGYIGASAAGDATVGQLQAPITGVRHSAGGWEAAARLETRRLFSGAVDGSSFAVEGSGSGAAISDRSFRIATYSHPGAEAPLGWVLSKVARADLRDQLEVNRAEIERLRHVLDADDLRCGADPATTPTG